MVNYRFFCSLLKPGLMQHINDCYRSVLNPGPLSGNAMTGALQAHFLTQMFPDVFLVPHVYVLCRI